MESPSTMPAEIPPTPNIPNGHCLSPTTRARCLVYARRMYPHEDIHEVSPQGFCSYTLRLGQHSILQFRPESHPIDLDIAAFARHIFGDLVPSIQLLPAPSPLPLLHIYLMPRLPGLSLAQTHQPPSPSLLLSLARFFALAWSSPSPRSPPPPNRRIGSSLRPRLSQLHALLPPRFRPVAARTLASLADIEALPWVLTHGDLIPSNIMVTSSGNGDGAPRLTGILDWAEAEYLPLGVGLYGVEEFLGESRGGDGGGGKYPPAGSTFGYFGCAAALRAVFWAELEAAVPLLAADGGFRESVERARVLGLLLWHGFAFDGGRLDRVVCEGRDDEEIQRLDVMLLGGGGGVPAAS
ncbi:hypothetical protein B0T18DRAFT_385473 [Schizothecium vesticola]|uniref:Aminoglycoside phosphotransferase domain-containing protein n=1 Tax=Schizothecium vesticola TaxID=314040 RepID=A0AA40F9X5_9PEZI|nr:hypothetical protein B0T18DRAFT_385473 [Schizothecium vesticola]